jgi:uncharacterized damage-inducible protein DinB
MNTPNSTTDIPTILTLLHYSRWANEQVLEASRPLPDHLLDQAIDMGRGSLRRTLIHLFAGDYVWFRRWQGLVETPWLDESTPTGVAKIITQFQQLHRERDEWVERLTATDLDRDQRYLDSGGRHFSATLGQMMLQASVHGTHHRAQAVNMLRQLGQQPPELDYMVHVRQPV